MSSVAGASFGYFFPEHAPAQEDGSETLVLFIVAEPVLI